MVDMILAWIFFAILVAVFGGTRTIGWGWALFWSLLLSPLVGFIIALCYPSKAKIRYQEEMLQKISDLSKAMQNKSDAESDQNPYRGEEIPGKIKGRGVTYKILDGVVLYSDGRKGAIKCLPTGQASAIIDDKEQIFDDVYYAADALYDSLPIPHGDDYFVKEPEYTPSNTDKIKADIIKATTSGGSWGGIIVLSIIALLLLWIVCR